MSQAVEEVETNKEDKKKVELEAAYIRFGLELKRIRESMKLTQVRVHELTGIDKTVLSELERGLYPPSLPIIWQLIEGLGVSPHLFTAAYYDIPVPGFNVKDKETLDAFIKLALDYLKPSILQPPNPIPPHIYQEDNQDIKGLKEASDIKHKEAEAKKKPPQKQKKQKTNENPPENLA
jgi:transcriptional regulator with XRE-family HTH domain